MQKSAPVRAQALHRPRARLSVVTLPAAAIILAAALMLAGCTPRSPLGGGGNAGTSKGDAAGTRQQAKQVQFADIPVPKGRKINVDKTVVVGTQVWFGQLTYDTSHGAAAMFDFYGRELPNYGWRKITSVRAQTSFMTYDRENRVMTIAIQENRIRGSEVTITVSPREEPQPPAPTGAVMPGAVMPGAPPATVLPPVRGAAPIMPPPVQRR